MYFNKILFLLFNIIRKSLSFHLIYEYPFSKYIGKIEDDHVGFRALFGCLNEGKVTPAKSDDREGMSPKTMRGDDDMSILSQDMGGLR